MTVAELIKELQQYNQNAEVHLIHSSRKTEIGIGCGYTEGTELLTKANVKDITLYIQNSPYNEEDF